ncbi:hypothetical protein AB6T38_16475 [Aliiglaciecola sp. SL4]|uniref:hypothetical protein n=1 Tax=Aliiglaciecola sp. SL4 TaxID=3239806 RepID=UPI00355C82F4
MPSAPISVSGTVIKGHQVASGSGTDSTYPTGTIEMQKPFFKDLGLDLSQCFNGTLNVQLAVSGFKILHPSFCFENVTWAQGFNPETFSFVKCQITFQGQNYSAWVYYPHPETKTLHFQQSNLIEILAPPIDNIYYGDQITLDFPAQSIEFMS